MRSNYNNTGVRRIGVFYDGTYFSHVSNYYLYDHPRQARITISGLHEFLREEVAKLESISKEYCQVVDAHYFRGRMSAKQTSDYDDKQLFKDRQFDDVLIREGVTQHYLPMSGLAGNAKEKGIDVWYALEAFELALYKRFDVSVLVTGDGDYVPLVRKLNTLGTRVMLLAWDFVNSRGNETRAAQNLIDEVTYPVMMSDEIDARTRKGDPIIDGIFMSQVAHERRAGTVQRAKEGGAAPSGEHWGAVFSLAENGYGFLNPDRGTEHAFFHLSDLPSGVDFKELKVGDRFRYTTFRKPDGKLAAKNLILEQPIDVSQS